MKLWDKTVALPDVEEGAWHKICWMVFLGDHFLKWLVFLSSAGNIGQNLLFYFFEDQLRKPINFPVFCLKFLLLWDSENLGHSIISPVGRGVGRKTGT